MVSNDDEIKVFHLDLPARTEDIAKLELGSAVYLNGLVYTAREGVYKKVLDEGLPLPLDLRSLSNVNFHCSPAAAPDGRGGYNVGAVTATASFRFSKWIPRWLDETGCRILIGKGGEMLKRIGTTSRKEIESLLGTRVFLELFVKVEEDWRSSSRFVEDLDWRRQLEDLAMKQPEE